MIKLFKKITLCTAVLLSISASAFNPPTDENAGMTLQIEGVKANEPVDQPLRFEVQLINNTSTDAQGTIKVWLNDDWDATPSESAALTVVAGKSHTLQCTATAKGRALAALYPVHASYTTPDGHLLHPIAIFKAERSPDTQAYTVKPQEVKAGFLRLDQTPHRLSFYQQKGTVTALGPNFSGTDPASRTAIQTRAESRGGVTRGSFNVHPPYQGGAGTTWNDFPLSLPADTKIELAFHTAIRDSAPTEGSGSDGVEFKVFVIRDNNTPQQLFTRFSAAKIWEKAIVDLSAYAGQTITLRLWTGPGPQNNTSCDSSFWGDPVVFAGDTQPSAPTPEIWAARGKSAATLARQALAEGGRPSRGCFVLNVRGEKFGVAVVPGTQGLTDGVIVFTDGKNELLYRGFLCQIDKLPVGAVEMGAPVVETKHRSFLGKFYLTHYVATPGGIVEARATLYADRGALRIAWDMPGVSRDARGTPRYTRLGIGPCVTPLKRAYAGLGNVIEEPQSFSLRGGGFTLATRHVGADYTNKLSLLQAADVFPDAAVYEKESERFALECPHDTSFYFIPSAQGAFAAARAYRDINGFKQSPGFKNTVGKMCLDQWGGDYADAAKSLALAGKYGVNDAIFVKHVWQRWGYDYRLPEIFPPSGNMDDFMRMRQAAKDAGMIFAPHDNYIDFYPDAAEYSYDHIVFNADGSPQLAWINEGRQAQSYRWLPHAFQPWMEANMRAMRRSFQPDGLFIDVFTAMPPIDYYDREGRYFTRNQTAKLWGEAFNTCRRILQRGAPMISEAGTDALIGAVDAAQSDHMAASRWMKDFGVAVRTPWHDMASHGRMVLLAGGLGPRYSALDWRAADRPMHGYGSDDYLSNTVIGGRNPMCDGPFSRRAVMTYWLLHDVCAELGRQDFESHAFGATILQQRTTFGKSGRVWSNRGVEPWRVADAHTLPQYGFYAECGDTRAGVVLLDGQRAAFAQSKTAVFVDARPLHDPGVNIKVAAEVTGGKYLGAGRFAFTVKWEVFDPVPASYKPFLHFDRADHELDQGENIAFQATLNLPVERLARTGIFETTTEFSIPREAAAGDYAIRFGMYNPANRLQISGLTGSGGRIKGGRISISKEESQFTQGAYNIENSDDLNALLEYNIAGKSLDFGAIQTAGAFRLLYGNTRSWSLVPLPGSRPFSAVIDLTQLGAGERTVKGVIAVEPKGEYGQEVEWSQREGALRVQLNGRAFAYEIQF
ncbi:MAG: hypothetical protein PHO37_03460 [Kiritimatiellae bacterium]|nr:hypothetical protein [Kiritimatiellia bacterium]